MKKKLIMVLVILMVMTTALAGCGGSSDDDTVKIGGLAPLTGDVAVYGIATKQGAEMAFEEINAAGGILDGKQIEFIVYDEKGDTTEAINGFNKLMGDGVVALLGDVTSKPTLAVATEAAAVNLPMITATASTADVTLTGDNVFRTCFIDPFQGKTMAVFAKENLGAESVAIMYNTSDDYSQGMALAFKEKSEELGMEVTNYEGYGNEDVDFKAQLTAINQNNPDVLFLPEYYTKVALIAAQAQEVGCDAQLIGGDGWDGVLETVTSADVVEGTYFCSNYSVDDTSEKTQAFVAAYEEKYGETPNQFAALGYDTAYILANAIDNAGSTDADAIIAALAATDYVGATGSVKFDENGDPIKSAAIIKILGGKHTFDSSVLPE